MKRSGFTIIELIFVIVVLGILSAIALPKFIGSQKNAVIARGKSDVSAIRAAIMNERQKRLVLGQVGLSRSLTVERQKIPRERRFLTTTVRQATDS